MTDVFDITAFSAQTPLQMLLAAWLIAINLAAFAVYGWDKSRSKVKGARRVPERTLFALALLGGSVGAIAGMRVFHHKTRHWYFRYGLPAILLAQLALATWLGVQI